jgi:hypothetical protein
MVSLDRPEPHVYARTGTWSMFVVLLLLLLFPFLAGACTGSVEPGPTRNVLNAVVALAANNVWAVGGMSTSKHFGLQVLIEHWDGQRWQTVMPDLEGELCAISADSANDIWAVGGGGYYNCSLGSQHPVLHWDGQRWQSLSAGISLDKGVLLSVLALSPRNVWAVGTSGRQALIEHWDGSSWKSVTQPYEGLASSLQAIAGRAANDLWAVGSAVAETGERGSLSEHWDGRSWKSVPMPGVMQDKRLLGNPDFPGLAAFPAGQLWAVGEIDLSSVYPPTPLIERWNGKQWEVAYGSAPQNPNLRTPEATLQSVIALDAQDAWAVGDTGTTDTRKTGYVLVYHWDGQSWQQIKAPSFLFGSQLSSISAVATDNIWAVGSTDTRLGSGDNVTLIEHWDGHSWQAVPSLNPGTPAPPIGQA